LTVRREIAEAGREADTLSPEAGSCSTVMSKGRARWPKARRNSEFVLVAEVFMSHAG